MVHSSIGDEDIELEFKDIKLKLYFYVCVWALLIAVSSTLAVFSHYKLENAKKEEKEILANLANQANKDDQNSLVQIKQIISSHTMALEGYGNLPFYGLSQAFVASATLLQMMTVSTMPEPILRLGISLTFTFFGTIFAVFIMIFFSKATPIINADIDDRFILKRFLVFLDPLFWQYWQSHFIVSLAFAVSEQWTEAVMKLADILEEEGLPSSRFIIAWSISILVICFEYSMAKKNADGLKEPDILEKDSSNSSNEQQDLIKALESFDDLDYLQIINLTKETFVGQSVDIISTTGGFLVGNAWTAALIGHAVGHLGKSVSVAFWTTVYAVGSNK
eukprot:GHVP01056075.1.p1 GENE.GHVP01056075.1~~GHVP01056075.1.p1  ORF type:complete len:334 (+),score=60.50 GHVP01056075.1:208-1209(+)